MKTRATEMRDTSHVFKESKTTVKNVESIMKNVRGLCAGLQSMTGVQDDGQERTWWNRSQKPREKVIFFPLTPWRKDTTLHRFFSYAFPYNSTALFFNFASLFKFL